MLETNDFQAKNEEFIEYSKNWGSLKFKEDIQSTYIDEISLKITTRYMAGRTKKTPVFSVKLEDEVVEISISKMGWKKAWKQALLTASSPSGTKSRRSIVRHLNRPPKISAYLKAA